MRALKSLGCDIDNAGYVYSELLLRKLPQKSKDNISRAHTEDTWGLEDLRTAIAKEIGHLQSLEENQEEVSEIKINSLNNISSFNTSVKFNNKSCTFCNKNHSIYSCPEYS